MQSPQHTNSTIVVMATVLVARASHLGKVLMFLLLGAVPDQLVDAEVGTVCIVEADGRTGTTHFLNSYAVVQVAKTNASIFLYVSEENRRAQMS